MELALKIILSISIPFVIDLFIWNTNLLLLDSKDIESIHDLWSQLNKENYLNFLKKFYLKNVSINNQEWLDIFLIIVLKIVQVILVFGIITCIPDLRDILILWGVI